MHTNKKKIALAVAAALALLAAAMGAFRIFDAWQSDDRRASVEDPVDVAHDFYGSWLAAAKSTSTNPYKEGLNRSTLLGEALRERLAIPHSGLDPVLCQTVPPEKFSTRTIYEDPDKAEILMTARKPSASTEQAVFTLLSRDGEWYVGEIQCSPGEFAPDVALTFDREGRLSKGASGFWILVFDEDGRPDHEAPLLFGAQSMCLVSTGGDAAVCNPGSLTDNAGARVQGQMTERGVDVTRVELR